MSHTQRGEIALTPPIVILIQSIHSQFVEFVIIIFEMEYWAFFTNVCKANVQILALLLFTVNLLLKIIIE